MSPPAKGKYLKLTEDADVRRWYENVSRGCQITADVYLRRLGSFCKTFNVAPKALVSLGEGKLHGLLLDCVSSMEKADHAGSYIESTLRRSSRGFPTTERKQ